MKIKVTMRSGAVHEATLSPRLCEELLLRLREGDNVEIRAEDDTPRWYALRHSIESIVFEPD